MEYFYLSSFSYKLFSCCDMQKHFLQKKIYHLKIWMCVCMKKLHSIFYSWIFHCCDQITNKRWLPGGMTDWGSQFVTIGHDFKEHVWIGMTQGCGSESLVTSRWIDKQSRGILCSTPFFLVPVVQSRTLAYGMVQVLFRIDLLSSGEPQVTQTGMPRGISPEQF